VEHFRGGLTVTYIYAPNLTGAGAARNIGVDRASSELLVFLDDDVHLEPDFLEKLVLSYVGRPEIGGVSGIVTNYSRPPLRQRLLTEVFCLGPFRDERMPLYWKANALRESPPIPIRKFTGCVMSFRRTALGPDRFDDRYPGAGAEDVDLSWRISERWKLILCPAVRAAHLQSPIGSQRDKWLFQAATQYYYLYYRLWRKSLVGRLCFVWLNIGFALLATLGSFKRRSLGPLHALRGGIAQARVIVFEGQLRVPLARGT